MATQAKKERKHFPTHLLAKLIWEFSVLAFHLDVLRRLHFVQILIPLPIYFCPEIKMEVSAQWHIVIFARMV